MAFNNGICSRSIITSPVILSIESNASSVLYYSGIKILHIFHFTEDPCYIRPCGNGTCHIDHHTPDIRYTCNCSEDYMYYDDTCYGKECHTLNRTLPNSWMKSDLQQVMNVGYWTYWAVSVFSSSDYLWESLIYLD